MPSPTPPTPTINIFSFLGFAVFLGLGCGTRPVAPVASPGHFSASDDFSATLNPSGPWAYGFTRSLGGPFELYKTTTVRYDPKLSQWTSPLGVDPNVAKNETGSDLAVAAGFTLPNRGFVYFHPGPQGEFSVIRWTAPRSGEIHLRAVFRAPENNCPTTSDVHVLQNSRTIFDTTIESANGKPDTAPRTFEQEIQVSQGDTVDFTVGFGSNASYSCDRTMVDAVVDYIP